MFSFSKEEKEFCGVRQIALMRAGKPDALLEETPMQLALLLSGKADRLSVNTQIEGEAFSFTTQQTTVARTPSVENGVPCLSVHMAGLVDEITVNGVPLTRQQQDAAARKINGYLEKLATALDDGGVGVLASLSPPVLFLCLSPPPRGPPPPTKVGKNSKGRKESRTGKKNVFKRSL